MDELETIIGDLIKRKNAAPMVRFYERQLQSLRYRHEDAGDLIEYYDFHWGSYCSPLREASEPLGQLVPMPQKRRSVPDGE